MTTETQEQPQDLSIEEILASIRQIISDDDDPSKAAAPVAAPQPVVADEDDDDVLNLTEEMMEAPKPAATAPAKEMDIDFSDPEPVAKKADADQFIEIPVAPVQEASQSTDESIFTDTAAAATMGAFAKLAENVLIEKSNGVRAVSGPSLEEIVRDLLKPMLREWIDKNVPRIVERAVQEELEKLARRARDD